MKKWSYYNDIDEYCCAWIRNLIKAGLVPDGEVDNRPIQEVQPEDVKDYIQCHFFGGILGWPLALKLAKWGAGRPVWTASCPCQPFSVAGKRKGTADDRHLWPHVHRLIRACRPPIVMGEQVSGKDGLAWLDGVVADMEKEGYTCRAADIPACAVNAPHRRNRLYWAAYSKRPRLEGSSRKIVQGGVGGFAGGGREHGRAAHGVGAGLEGRQSERLDTRQEREAVERGCDPSGGMEHSERIRRQRREGTEEGSVDDRPDAGWVQGDDGPVGADEASERMDDAPEPRLGPGRLEPVAALRDASRRGELERRERDGRVGDGNLGLGNTEFGGRSSRAEIDGKASGCVQLSVDTDEGYGGLGDPNQPGEVDGLLQRGWELSGSSGDPQADIGFWSDFALAGPDREGKYRRVGLVRESEPGVLRMVDGLSAGMAGVRPIDLLVKNAPQRVNKLRALGNAIVPPLAAIFVATVREMIDAHKDT